MHNKEVAFNPVSQQLQPERKQLIVSDGCRQTGIILRTQYTTCMQCVAATGSAAASLLNNQQLRIRPAVNFGPFGASRTAA